MTVIQSCFHTGLKHFILCTKRTCMKNWVYLRKVCDLAPNSTPLYLWEVSPKIQFSLNRPSGPIQSISRDVHVCVCLSVCKYVCLLSCVTESISRDVRVCVSVCLSVRMYITSCEVPFKCLFAPIYKGPRSNFFRIFVFLREKLRK